MTHPDVSRIQQTSFWTLPPSEVAGLLGTDVRVGLTEQEAQRRRKTYGANVIEQSRRIASLVILLSQFKSPLILILLVAGVVTLGIGHGRDASFIFAAVLINAALGFFQEYKAEQALAELKTYLKQRTRVIRDGTEREIDASKLVPGDMVHLSQGDRIPADARIYSVNDIQIDEAILTGESLPVPKSVDTIEAEAAIGDQSGMVFAGTLVVQGTLTAIVCRTGLSTEIGKISTLVAQAHGEETPMQAAIRKFSVRAGLFLGVLTLIIFFTGLALGYSRVDMFLTSVAIAVSAVPEGLPVALTVILSIGVQRMARRKGVIRKLVAAETLGGATVILTDKTGTLTMANMELSSILPVIPGDDRKILELALINTNVLVENPDEDIARWRVSGRILETALVRSAALRGARVDEIQKRTTIISSLPFNAVNKYSATLIREGDTHILVFFGAPDIFIGRSTQSAPERERTLRTINELAESGELVVGVATKRIEYADDFSFATDTPMEGITFRGCITLRDPIRPSVAVALKAVEAAGIRAVIVSGDHRGTVEFVARGVGMEVGAGAVLDSSELHTISDAELLKRLPLLRVISRVSPLDKMRIVTAYQALGEIVAMTGDGVNDAPSIKRADVGIAMGSGTEVARDVADLVILDDNFETIAAAVEEGRQILNNIRKVLVYLLSDVADELLLIGGALLTGVALPLNALQILYVNFFSDSFPAVAFAFEKGVDGLGARPRSSRAGLFDPMMKFLILFIGISTSALLFVLYWVLLKLGYPEDIVRTFIFAGFGCYTLFLAFSVRSLEKSILSYPFFSNRYLVAGVSIGMLLMIMAIYVPFFQALLNTTALPVLWVLGVVAIGILNIGAVEVGKWIYRRKAVAV